MTSVQNGIDTTSADWLSAIEPAEVVEGPDAVRWDDSSELVVVGYGGGGVAAALTAAENGIEVLAIDRYDGGGSTAINGGIFYAGGGTAIQKEAGVHDTPEEMFRYLKIETAGVVKDTTLRRFCEGSAASVDWLLEHGVKLNSRLFTKKWGYPDPRYFLYYSDNSLAPSRASKARPAPRGHRMHHAPVADGRYGRFLYEPLRDAASRAGVRLMPQTEVRQLIIDKSGAILGVKVLVIPPNTKAWRDRQKYQRRANELTVLLPPSFPGARFTYALAARQLAKVAKLEQEHRIELRIRATAGVCLSAGGFIYNRPMIHRYAPHHDASSPMGNPGDDGSGIRLGQSVGGVVDRMGLISSWRFLNPPGDWVKGMIVNAKGKRFTDETLYGATIGHALNEEQGGVGHLIFDREVNRRAWKDLFTVNMLGHQRYPGILSMWSKTKARTIEDLARKIGVDPISLRESVEAYNRITAGTERDPFQKDQKETLPIINGPFYAINISGSNKLLPMFSMTLGGLKVSEETGEVLQDMGRVIPGLYAAGRTAIGICSNVYMSGLSAADCIFSGRRVGQHVAERLGRIREQNPTACALDSAAADFSGLSGSVDRPASSKEQRGIYDDETSSGV